MGRRSCLLAGCIVLGWEQGCCSLAGALHSLVMAPGDISCSLAPLVCSSAGEGRTEPASISIEMHQNNAKYLSHSFITIKGRESIQEQVQLLMHCLFTQHRVWSAGPRGGLEGAPDCTTAGN